MKAEGGGRLVKAEEVKKVKLFWSFPAQLGKHCCSYQVIEVSTCHCQKGWMNVFLLACMWLLSEYHSRSFQVEKLWQVWEFLFRSDSANMQNQCHWSFCLCDCLWHCLILTWKRHLSFGRTKTGKDCRDFPQLCCTNVCPLLSWCIFIAKPGSPRGPRHVLWLLCYCSCSWWVWRTD